MESEQARLAASFALRADLKARVIAESELRTARVRKTVGTHALPDDQRADCAASALGHAYYLAAAARFAEERALSNDWFVGKRRLHAKNGKDRSMDDLILRQYYPEFAEYAPALADEEILRWAKVAYRDQVAGPGSDYHQLEAQNKLYREDAGFAHGHPMPAQFRMGYHGRFHSTPKQERRGVFTTDGAKNAVEFCDAVDLTSQHRVENPEFYRLVENPDFPIGPHYITPMAVAIREFGDETAVFWLAEFLAYTGQHTSLLREVGITEEHLGKAEFERTKKNLQRHLPKVHARMMELLRAEPEFTHLAEVVDFPLVCGAPLPESEAATAARACCQSERARSVARNVAKMLAAVRADAALAPLAAAVAAAHDGAETISPILAAFMKADNPLKRQGWAREVVKQFGKK